MPEAQRLLDAPSLRARTAEVAEAISRDHPDGVTLVGVLKGSVVFLADLARAITVPVRLELVALAPYDGASGRTRMVKDLDRSIAGEAVVIVTGIVDTGLTVDFLRRHLIGSHPRSLRVATLADKRARRLLPVPVDYVVAEAPDAFLLGHGLDYAGRYRNLAGLWLGDADALAADPDHHVGQLYPEPTGEARR